jgi:hypothetical protein
MVHYCDCVIYIKNEVLHLGFVGQLIAGFCSAMMGDMTSKKVSSQEGVS